MSDFMKSVSAFLKVKSRIVNKRLKPLAFIGMSIPMIWLAVEWYIHLTTGSSELGYQPIEFTNRHFGEWTFNFLVIGLALTPASWILKTPLPIAFRRMVGLFAFTIGVAHLLNYVVVDHYFNWPVLWEDIVKRPFITIGFIALLLMVPMAMTSTNKMIRRLGAKRWQKLHRLVYLVVPLGAIHYWMMAKGDLLEPILWFIGVIFLLGFRVYWLKFRPKKAREKS